MPTSGLRAGAARVDITPEDLTGLNPFGPSFDRVHDPIHARALVLENDLERVALVALDLVEVGDTSEVRARIERELGIPADHVLLAPSHDHNAPRIGLVPAGGKARIPTPESLVYTERVYDAIVAVLQDALNARRPARIGSGIGEADVNVNREVYVDGRWGLGYNENGPSDKTLRVVSITDEDGASIALVVNYAVHSTVALGVPELSGDLAGNAARTVEDQLGRDAVALWLSGALGDQAPRVELGAPTSHPERDRALAFRAVDAQGLLVGMSAVRVARSIDRFHSDVRLTGQIRVVPCPARRLEVPPGMEQADVDTVDLTLTVITAGTTAFAGVSGEVTLPVYRAVQLASPLADLLLVSNANARIGYLPTDESYDRRTQAAEGCPIVQGFGEAAIVEGLTDLIEHSLS